MKPESKGAGGQRTYPRCSLDPISLSRVLSPSLRMDRCSWRSEIPRSGVDVDDDSSSLTTRHLVAVDDRFSSCFREITDSSRKASTCDKMRQA